MSRLALLLIFASALTLELPGQPPPSMYGFTAGISAAPVSSLLPSEMLQEEESCTARRVGFVALATVGGFTVGWFAFPVTFGAFMSSRGSDYRRYRLEFALYMAGGAAAVGVLRTLVAPCDTLFPWSRRQLTAFPIDDSNVVSGFGPFSTRDDRIHIGGPPNKQLLQTPQTLDEGAHVLRHGRQP